MYQRQRFVLDAEHTPASFAELCRRYDISRKTGYRGEPAAATVTARSTNSCRGCAVGVYR